MSKLCNFLFLCLVCFAIAACGGGGGATTPATGSNAAETVPPSTPANLAAAAFTHNSVTLAWDASTDNVGVTGYYVYRNDVKVGQSPGTTFNDVGLSAATAYAYQVKAFDKAGNISSGSNSLAVTTSAEPVAGDTAPPSAPANLRSGDLAINRVALAWDASSDDVGVVGYYVFRDGINIGQTASTTFQDATNVAAETTYQYQIKAYDAANNLSVGSNTVTVTTPQAITINFNGQVQ